MPRPANSVKNASLLAAALEGLEIQRTRLDEQISQVKAMLGKRGPRKGAIDVGSGLAGAAAPRKKRRTLSAAARARIAAAQKKRWAEFRKEATT